MILIENSTNKVIISSNDIILNPDHAVSGNKKYYGGITNTTHTLITNKTIPYGQSNWWIFENNDFTITDIGLNELKEQKKSTIKNKFNEVENEPVTINSIEWNGGYESAQKLDGAKRMAELLSQTSVTFYDLANVGHTLTIAEAEVIITTIGIDYQTKFANKQAKLVAVDNATTLEELDAITW